MIDFILLVTCAFLWIKLSHLRRDMTQMKEDVKLLMSQKSNLHESLVKSHLKLEALELLIQLESKRVINSEQEVVQPEVVQPEVVQPEVVQPEVVQPEVVQPEVVQPEVVQPEVVQPEVIQPEVVQQEITPSPVEYKDQLSLEEHIGSYWLVRIGVLLVLTSMILLGYSQIEVLLTAPIWIKIIALYTVSFALLSIGYFLNKKAKTFPNTDSQNYTEVIYAGGLAAIYLSTYAGYAIPALTWIHNIYWAQILLTSCALLILYIAHKNESQIIAFFAVTACYYSLIISQVHQVDAITWLDHGSTLIIATVIVVLIRVHRWQTVPFWSMALVYASHCFQHYHADEVSLSHFIILLCIWIIHALATVQQSIPETEEQYKKQQILFAITNHSLFSLIFIHTTYNGFISESRWSIAIIAGLTSVIALTLTRLMSSHSTYGQRLQKIHHAVAYLSGCYALFYLGMDTGWLYCVLFVWSILMRSKVQTLSYVILGLCVFNVLSIVHTQSVPMLTILHLYIMVGLLLVMMILETRYYTTIDSIDPMTKELTTDTDIATYDFNLLSSYHKGWVYLSLLACMLIILGHLQVWSTTLVRYNQLDWTHLVRLLLPIIIATLVLPVLPRWNHSYQNEARLTIHIGCVGIAQIPIFSLLESLPNAYDQLLLLGLTLGLTIFVLSYEVFIQPHSVSFHSKEEELAKSLSKYQIGLEFIQWVYILSLLISSWICVSIYGVFSWQYLCLLVSMILLAQVYSYKTMHGGMTILAHLCMLVLVVLYTYQWMNDSLIQYIELMPTSIQMMVAVILSINIVLLMKGISEDLSQESPLDHASSYKAFIQLPVAIYDLYVLIIVYATLYGNFEWRNAVHIALLIHALLACYTQRVEWKSLLKIFIGVYSFIHMYHFIEEREQLIIDYLQAGYFFSFVMITLLFSRLIRSKDQGLANLLLWSSIIQWSFYIYAWSTVFIGLSLWLLPIAFYTYLGFKHQEQHARYIVLSILAGCILALVPMIWGLSSSLKLLAFLVLGITFMVLGWFYHKKSYR